MNTLYVIFKYTLHSGTSHRVNGILIQHEKFCKVDETGRELESKRKRSRRSFVLPEGMVQFSSILVRVGQTWLYQKIKKGTCLLIKKCAIYFGFYHEMPSCNK